MAAIYGKNASVEYRKIKRFLVFGGDCYYASGGANDFLKSFVSEVKATEYARALMMDRTLKEDFWVNVFDVLSCEIVFQINEPQT